MESQQRPIQWNVPPPMCAWRPRARVCVCVRTIPLVVHPGWWGQRRQCWSTCWSCGGEREQKMLVELLLFLFLWERFMDGCVYQTPNNKRIWNIGFFFTSGRCIFWNIDFLHCVRPIAIPKCCIYIRCAVWRETTWSVSKGEHETELREPGPQVPELSSNASTWNFQKWVES